MHPEKFNPRKCCNFENTDRIRPEIKRTKYDYLIDLTKRDTLATVVTTEVGKAAAIFAVLALHLVGSLVLLPLLGMMLNGTSSVLYGSVPELVSAKRIERAFALFYTSILGSSALAPVLYGPA